MRTVASSNVGSVRSITADVLSALVFAVPLTALGLLAVYGSDLGSHITLGNAVRAGIAMTIAEAMIFCAIVGWNGYLALQRLDRAEVKLGRLEQTDPLTGLLNRRAFDRLSAQVAATAERRPQSVVALALNLDFIKKINDEHGHAFGDAALRHVAGLLQEGVGKAGGIVARPGGEEFVALMIGINAEDAKSLAEDLRRACAAEPVVCERKSAVVTVSIGLAASTRWKGDLGALFERARVALDAAKEAGHNGVAVDAGSPRVEAA